MDTLPQHYEILKAGSGEEVEWYSSPLIHIKREHSERDEILALDEASPELKLGIVGMREGEIRKVYVDSDEPIEIEILKADAAAASHKASNKDYPSLFR